MYPVLFQLGPITIYSLGALWALGALAATWIVHLELKRYRFDPELASSMVLIAAVGGLVGARALLILEEWDAFLRSPWSFIFSGAGFSWYGGLFGGALAVAWWIRRKGLPWLKLADIAAPALALGYGIGRIGCFLAGDATWGKVTNVPWAMAFPNAVFGWVDPLTGVPYPPGVRVHPTQLYELIQSLIVFGVLWPLRKKGYPDGTIFWLYLILAASMRFAVEFLRANPVVALGMTEYQWISLFLVVLGVVLILRVSWQRVGSSGRAEKRNWW
ncbi:MAG: prolipoprotein diacylglyceryl transferase [Deltaproteobacteria bacterium]|nr:prolipoprotein diacylglyceryl transferase [Deltaproteobacteria bacterium]